jgi:two-component system cell cycle response regulator
VTDVALISRVRSLARLKMVTDELRMRALTTKEIGIQSPEREAVTETGRDGRILIVDDRPSSYERIVQTLQAEHTVEVQADPAEALFRIAEGNYELAIVSLGLKDHDGLRLCSQIRSLERTRNLPILAIIDFDERGKLVKALEIGVNDVLAKPVDPGELSARAKTQIRRKRYTDYLRDNLDHSLELAVTDQLTGLHNRRYMAGQLDALVRRAAAGGDAVAVRVIDIDHFKKVNDSFGHAVGDEVLREFAVRLASNVRAIDLPVRFGGEEFVVVMPDTELEHAQRIAERIRLHVAGSPFRVMGGEELLTVTISIGVAASLGECDASAPLIKRADEAMYEAKSKGRNRVVARAA